MKPVFLIVQMVFALAALSATGYQSIQPDPLGTPLGDFSWEEICEAYCHDQLTFYETTGPTPDQILDEYGVIYVIQFRDFHDFGNPIEDKLGILLTLRDSVNPDLVFIVETHRAGLYATDYRNLQQVIRLRRHYRSHWEIETQSRRRTQKNQLFCKIFRNSVSMARFLQS